MLIIIYYVIYYIIILNDLFQYKLYNNLTYTMKKYNDCRVY